MPRIALKYWVRTRALEKALERSGLTQTDLALALGVNAATVTRWKKGERPVSPYTAARIAAFLRVPVDVLFKEQLFIGSRLVLTYRPSAQSILSLVRTVRTKQRAARREGRETRCLS